MTPVFDQRITDPAAWNARDIDDGAALVRRLSAQECAAIERLADAVADRPVHGIGRVDFSDPLIDALMDEVRDAVMNGRGAMVVSGLDIGGMPVDRFERIYWGLGTHLGNGAIQGPLGDWVARVEKSEDNPTGRGTLMDVELRPHTDMHEVMALACYSMAQSGGESALVSSLGIHNAIYEERPDLLAPLYRGYWAGNNPAIPSVKPLSDAPVPIFCNVDGLVSCYYNKFFLMTAAKMRGEALPADLVEAMDYFDELAIRPEMGANFMLKPGEMLFWHNFKLLHARQSFHDAPGAKRLLLRLWLNLPDGRPVDPLIAERARIIDIDHFAAAGLEMADA